MPAPTSLARRRYELRQVELRELTKKLRASGMSLREAMDVAQSLQDGCRARFETKAAVVSIRR